jgi:hypothetical protein
MRPTWSTSQVSRVLGPILARFPKLMASANSSGVHHLSLLAIFLIDGIELVMGSLSVYGSEKPSFRKLRKPWSFDMCQATVDSKALGKV